MSIDYQKNIHDTVILGGTIQMEAQILVRNEVLIKQLKFVLYSLILKAQTEAVIL